MQSLHIVMEQQDGKTMSRGFYLTHVKRARRNKKSVKYILLQIFRHTSTVRSCVRVEVAVLGCPS